jgi:hypothetical protein
LPVHNPGPSDTIVGLVSRWRLWELALATGVLTSACAAREIARPEPRGSEPLLEPVSTPVTDGGKDAPAAQTPDAAAHTEPGCVPVELRDHGRVVAAEITAGGDLAFCVQRGYATDAPKRCLLVRLNEGRFDESSEVPSGLRFATLDTGISEGLATASYSEDPKQFAGGTVDVCRDGTCMTLKVLHSGAPPVLAVGRDRVLVARTELRQPPVARAAEAPTPEAFIDLLDLTKKTRVRSVLVVKAQHARRLTWLGKRALLETCKGWRCEARVIDPATLASTKLPIELELGRPAQGAAGDDGLLAHRTAAGAWVLVDARGRHAIWIGEDGKIIRHAELGRGGDSGSVAVGHRNAAELIVLPAGPRAGQVVRVALDGSSVVTVEAPTCQ